VDVTENKEVVENTRLRTVANGNYIGMAIDFGFRVREGIEKKSCEVKTRKTAWDRTAKYSCTNWVRRK